MNTIRVRHIVHIDYVCNESWIQQFNLSALLCYALSCKRIPPVIWSSWIGGENNEWQWGRSESARHKSPCCQSGKPIRCNISAIPIQCNISAISVQYQCNTIRHKPQCCQSASRAIPVCSAILVLQYCVVRYSRLAHSHPSPGTFILGRADCLDIWMTRGEGEGGYFCGEGGIQVILGPIWQTPFLLILILWHNIPAGDVIKI